MALGVKIAEEVGANEDRNTTGKWIAHYLAEKIEAAKADPSLEAECVDLILKLWASRRNFPNGDPLSRYDRLLPELEKLLTLERRFFPSAREDSHSDEPGEKWLKAAAKLDRISSGFIAELLRRGVRDMAETDDAILELADAIEGNSQTQAIRIFKSWASEDEPETDDPKERFVKLIEELRELLTEVETEGSAE